MSDMYKRMRNERKVTKGRRSGLVVEDPSKQAQKLEGRKRRRIDFEG
jgi:hypothetical protein